MSSEDQKAEQKASWRPWPLVRFLLIFAVLAWALRSFISAPFSIPSGSMLPTMWVGDYLFTAKWPYGYSSASFPGGIPSFDGRVLGSMPERGDVIIFKHPDTGRDWVKRVIGLPGDRIAGLGGQIFINGQPVRREPVIDVVLRKSPNTPCQPIPGSGMSIVEGDEGTICRYPAFKETLPEGKSYMVLDQAQGATGDDFGPVTVPDGHLFLMGDNRDDSLDSRFTVESGGIGFVPVDRIVGRAAVAFWSTDGSSSYFKPWTWFSALRADRIGTDFQP